METVEPRAGRKKNPGVGRERKKPRLETELASTSDVSHARSSERTTQEARRRRRRRRKKTKNEDRERDAEIDPSIRLVRSAKKRKRTERARTHHPFRFAVALEHPGWIGDGRVGGGDRSDDGNSNVGGGRHFAHAVGWGVEFSRGEEGGIERGGETPCRLRLPFLLSAPQAPLLAFSGWDPRDQTT